MELIFLYYEYGVEEMQLSRTTCWTIGINDKVYYALLKDLSLSLEVPFSGFVTVCV